MPLSMVETYLIYQKDKSSNASVNGRLTSYTRRINLVMPLSMLETYLLHDEYIRRINQVMPLSMVETYLLYQKDKPSNASVNGRLTSYNTG